MSHQRRWQQVSLVAGDQLPAVELTLELSYRVGARLGDIVASPQLKVSLSGVPLGVVELLCLTPRLGWIFVFGSGGSRRIICLQRVLIPAHASFLKCLKPGLDRSGRGAVSLGLLPRKHLRLLRVARKRPRISTRGPRQPEFRKRSERRSGSWSGLRRAQLPGRSGGAANGTASRLNQLVTRRVDTPCASRAQGMLAS